MTLEFDADEDELKLFLVENNEHLQNLDQCIVQLETLPDDQTLLQSIFRSAHTIKGGAGLIGHQRMADLAHAMESVLDGLRSHTLRANPTTIDTLLAALDALRLLNEEVVTRAESAIDVPTVIAALDGCLAQDEPGPAATPPLEDRPTLDSDAGSGNLEADAPPARGGQRDAGGPGGRCGAGGRRDPQAGTPGAPRDATHPALSSLARGPSHLYHVQVTVDPACGLSAARTMQIYLDLSRTCELVSATPTLEEIERDASTNSLSALVVTDELPSLLEHRLSRMPDAIEARVEPAQPDTTTTDLAATAGSQLPPHLEVSTEDRPASVDDGAPPRTEKAIARNSSVRISTGILDDLMALVSELVLSRTRLQTVQARLRSRYRDHDDVVTAYGDAIDHLEHVCSDLQSAVMKARMLPVENVFNKFPRLVRDLAAQQEKKVTFTMSGRDTELDRSVIEQLSDPLIHLLRNAVDHGLEPPEQRLLSGKPESGTIALSATPCENHILIEVRDDGRGLDADRLRATAIAKGIMSAEAVQRLDTRESMELIFAPGFSTAGSVTDISGRGVGMDIVKSTIERMGGHVRIESEPGAGTCFSMTLPLTLAIMQALLVSVDGAIYALPLNVVGEIMTAHCSGLHMLHGTQAIVVRGHILPLLDMREFLRRPPAPPSDTIRVVAAHADGQRLGLIVDEFIGEQEIVMKPLGAYLGSVHGLSGATILGDGRIGLLIDVAALRGRGGTDEHAVAA